MHRKLQLLKRSYANAQETQDSRLHPFAVPFLVFGTLLILSVLGYFLLVRPNPPAHDAKVVIISHDHSEQTVPSVEPTVGALLKKLDIKLGEGDVVEPDLATKINQDEFRINIYRAVPVEIVDGGHKTFTFSAAKTSRSVARQNGVSLYAEDIVTTDPVQDFLKDGAIGEQVTVDRAQPVNLNLYGTQLPIRTHATTVGALIREKRIHLAKDDQVTPGPATPIAANQQIFITRNGIKIESVTEPIAMPVQTIDDPSLAYGTSAVRQAGSPGQQVITYQINLQNGREINRTAIQTVVTQQPVTQIVVRGINLGGIKGDMALAGINPNDYNYVDYIVSHESGWNPHAQNASGAYGLCQALPGSKMASAGSDWQDNPVTQLRWCDGYAKGHYGSWYAAYNYWLSHHYW